MMVATQREQTITKPEEELSEATKWLLRRCNDLFFLTLAYGLVKLVHREVSWVFIIVTMSLSAIFFVWAIVHEFAVDAKKLREHKKRQTERAAHIDIEA